MTSLLEELPKIVADGRKRAEQLLDGLSSNYRLGLQTREIVVPSRDSSMKDLLSPGQKATDGSEFNRLIYGDNLLAMAALIAETPEASSFRGKIDLVYIDPPYDSKADYRTSIQLPSISIEKRPTVIEQFAYSDTWENGSASYIKMLVPRLILIRELLSDTGSIFLHVDWHVSHFARIILDEIFGRDNFRNEIAWCYGGGGGTKRLLPAKAR